MRRLKIRGVVDSGAMRLVIPESVVKKLGLETSGSVKVRHADDRTGERAVGERVRLSYSGREGIYSAIFSWIARTAASSRATPDTIVSEIE